MVHLGLGAFARAHQVWFTQAADDGWGVVAFTGRRPDAARVLTEQGCVYTLVERSEEGDVAHVVDALLEAHDGAAVDAWRAATASPETAVVTVTITEAGHLRTPAGGIDLAHPDVAADVEALRAGRGCRTAPGRLVDGLRARRAAGGEPIALVSCDNLTANGEVLREVVRSLAEAVGDPGLVAWIGESVSFVSSMVDRITPATSDADRAGVAALTGWEDPAVVVAEPFAEWVLSGSFPAGHPAWERAGARFVDDLAPFEHRKLWLLNGAHTLLACLGLLLGHETVDRAMADPRCATAVEALWDEAAAVLPLPADEVEGARAALRERFRNPRIQHRLQQVVADGSLKLPIRIVAPLRLRLASGLPIGQGEATAIAAWLLHLRDQPGLVRDAAAPEDRTVAGVLRAIAPDLAERQDLVSAVAAAVDAIEQDRPGPPTGASARG